MVSSCLDTIEGSKDQFTEDELKLLKEAAEKIREIENKLTMIEKSTPRRHSNLRMALRACPRAAT